MRKIYGNFFCIIFFLTVVNTTTCFAGEKIIITQEDEDEIISLSKEFNEYISKVISPGSSDIPFHKFKESDAYEKLIKFDSKLVPYIIRQIKFDRSDSIRYGEALTGRKITLTGEYDEYLVRRNRWLKDEFEPYFEYLSHELLLGQTSISKEILEDPEYQRDKELFSWVNWWEKNSDRFEFKTEQPLKIDTGIKFFQFPRVSTTKRGELLDIDACGVPCKMLIERAAAELGITVFLGDCPQMERKIGFYLRSVTFDEFCNLLELILHSGKLPYTKTDGAYHFGGEKEAPSAPVQNGREVLWWIKADKTVFFEGDEIPLIIMPRRTRISPPSFFHSFLWSDGAIFLACTDWSVTFEGGFRIINNEGKIVNDYHIMTLYDIPFKFVHQQILPEEIVLDLSKFHKLPPGEYSVSFKCLQHETPPIPIEIYPNSIKTGEGTISFC